MKKSRGLLWLFAVLILLQITYVIGANTFIRGEMLKKLIGNPNNTAIDYENAWTFFPGIVHVEKFVLRDQDKNVQWQFEIDRVVLSIRLFSLLQRTLKVTDLDGEGGRFVLRLKKDKPEENKHAPEVPAFTGEPENTEISDAKRFRFDISNMKIRNFREMWVDGYRFVGVAELNGSFYVWPTVEFRVLPSSIDVQSGRILIGDEEVMGEIRATIKGSIDEFPTIEKAGGEVIDYLSGVLEMKGDLVGAHFFNLYLQSIDWIRFDKMGGTIDASVKVSKGKFEAPSDVKIEAKDLNVHLSSLIAKGSSVIHWKQEKEFPSLYFKVGDYDLIDPANKKVVMHGSDLEVKAQSHSAHLIEAFKKLKMKIILPPATTSDLSYFNNFIPEYSDLRFEKGRATLKGFLNVNSHGPSDESLIVLSAEELGVRYGEVFLKGDLLVNARLKDVEDGSDIYDISQTKVTFDRVRAEGKTNGNWFRKDKDWVGELEIVKANWYPRGDPVVSGDISISMSDLRPILEVYSVKKKISGWIRTLLNFKNVRSSADLAIGKKTMMLNDVMIKTDGIDLQGWLNLSKGHRNGVAIVDLGIITVGVDVKNKETNVKLSGAKKWFRQQLEQKNK